MAADVDNSAVELFHLECVLMNVQLELFFMLGVRFNLPGKINNDIGIIIPSCSTI
jgi:hypothetical protein